MNGPSKFIDPDGNDIVYFNSKGQEVSRTVSEIEFKTYVGAEGNYIEATMPKIIKGYENPIYQKYDYNIAAQTCILSASERPNTAGGKSYDGEVPDLDPTLVKAMIVQETEAGTYDGPYGQKGKSDIMQANVTTKSGSTDWYKGKADFGLKKGPNQSLFAGIRILYTKGIKTSEIKDKKGRVIGFAITWRGDSWNQAVEKYNGGGVANYLKSVLNYLDNATEPNIDNYVEAKKKKKK